MNASRRICCNAANAFRPSLALRSVFYDSIGRQCPGRSSLAARNSQEDSRFTQRRFASKKFRRVLPKKESTQDEEIAAALEDEVNEVPTEQKREALERFAKPATEDIANDGCDQPEEDVGYDTALSAIEGLYVDGNPYKTEEKKDSSYASPKLAEIEQKKAARKENEVLEYEGQYVMPTSGPSNFSGLPWMEALDPDVKKQAVSADKRLNSEIEAFAHSIRPTHAETWARQKVIAVVKRIIKVKTRNIEVEVFGSTRNGLSLASSDVDLRVFKAADATDEPASWMSDGTTAVPPRWKTRKAHGQLLRHLQNVFMDHKDYILCTIRHARYPLLHMQHKPSGIDVQIVCANDTSRQREWIAKTLQENPQVVDIYAVLKTMLDIRGLTDVYRGGLGSYAILVMIVAALQQQKVTPKWPQKMSRAPNTTGTAADLLSVMRYWSYIDTYKWTMSVEPRIMMLPKIDPDKEHHHRDLEEQLRKEKYRQLRLVNHSEPYLLCLIDPTDPTNDLGRQAFGWKHIQATFQYLYKGIGRKMHFDDHVYSAALLGPMIGASDRDYRFRRSLAAAYGEGLHRQNPVKRLRVGMAPSNLAHVSLKDTIESRGEHEAEQASADEEAREVEELQSTDLADAATCVTVPDNTEQATLEAEGKAIAAA